MKKLMIAATALVAMTATATYAEEFYWTAETEYAVEAGVFTTELGFEYNIEQFYIAPTIKGDNAGKDFDFVGLEVEAGATITSGVDVYVRLETDNDLKYSETFVGLRAKF